MKERRIRLHPENAIRLRLENLERRAANLANEAQQVAREAAELRVHLFSDFEGEKPDVSKLTRDDGRLTEAGVAAVNAAFETGLTNAEISKRFGITASAVSQRRKVWVVQKYQRADQ